MSAVCYFGYLKFKFFSGRIVIRPILHYCTNFVKIGQTVAEILQFFCNFLLHYINMAAAILDFQKFEMLAVIPLQRGNVHNRGKFLLNWSNGCRGMALSLF